MTIPRVAVALAAALALGCGDEGSDAGGFAGEWTGTKTYLTTDGDVLATAPGWDFVIEPAPLRFNEGPRLERTGPATARVERYVFPPSYPPGPPGHCGPITATVLGGAVTLHGDDALTAELRWRSECGGVASESVARYEMTRATAQPDRGIPSL